MAETTKKKVVTEEDLRNIKYVTTTERNDTHEALGVLVVEKKDAKELQGDIKIKLGYETPAKIGEQDIIIALFINVPTVDDDLYYPLVEWRITQERLDDCDTWPQWKSFPVLLNGQQQMDSGRVVMAQHFIYRAIQSMEEDQDGRFFTEPPFAFDLIQMSDKGIPVIKGSDIDAARVQMLASGIGATRRRGA